jgi:hypothetical protein
MASIATVFFSEYFITISYPLHIGLKIKKAWKPTAPTWQRTTKNNLQIDKHSPHHDFHRVLLTEGLWTVSIYSETGPFALISTFCNGWPPLWSSGQSSWLQIQGSGLDFWCYQIFWEVVGLERSPLSLVSTTEELLGRKNSGSGLESREYGRKDAWHCPRDTLYPQKLSVTYRQAAVALYV